MVRLHSQRFVSRRADEVCCESCEVAWACLLLQEGLLAASSVLSAFLALAWVRNSTQVALVSVPMSVFYPETAPYVRRGVLT